ncbi:MAG: hypothetical protein ACTSXQ_06935 [Alphaproteobacteria bacterium]
MIKRLLTLFLLTASLSACASDALPLLDEGDSVPDDKAIVIGKINITPKLDEDGKVVKGYQSADPLKLQVVFSKGSAVKRNRSDVFDKDYDSFYEDVKPGRFFAAEVDPKNGKISWIGYFTNLDRERPSLLSRMVKKYPSDEEYGVFTSNVRGFKMTTKKTLKGGGVYYIGTLNVKLRKDSFVELGDDEYNFKEVKYLIPGALGLANEYVAARSWFSKNFDFKGVVQNAVGSVENLKAKSKYIRTIVVYQ